MSDGITDAWRMQEEYHDKRALIEKLMESNPEFKRTQGMIDKLNREIRDLKYTKGRLEHRLKEIIKEEERK